MLLGPKTGPLDVFLRELFGSEKSPFDIYSLWGIIWVMSLGSVSFLFIFLSQRCATGLHLDRGFTANNPASRSQITLI